MASRNLSDAHPILQAQYKLAKEAFEARNETHQVIITATYRSPEEQDQLYAQGRTKPGQRVTNARAGQSPHNYMKSLAIDVAFVKRGTKSLDWSNALFDRFQEFMKNPKITWGGHFKSLKDRPHFELTGWKALAGK